MTSRTWLVAGALLGLLSVTLGAFGAHGLEHAVRTWNLSDAEQLRRLHNWDVAVRYQMYHALALLGVGILALSHDRRSLHVAGSAWVLGVLAFSGCLYGYVLSGSKVLVLIVPLGGLTLIVGWLALLVAVWSLHQKRSGA